MNKSNIKSLKIALSIVFLVVLGYFVNKGIQTYLGQQALDDTGLPIISLEQALTKAKESNKWILADMSAIWCPTCRKLDKYIFANVRVQQVLAEHFVFARIEYDSPEGKSFMQKYNVLGFPTLLVLSKSGEMLTQLPVTFEPSTFIDNLQQVIETKMANEERIRQ